MTKDWKKPKASHKHVVCERVDLFWLQDVSKENWDDTSKASDWLLIGRMDGGTSASPHYSFTQGCQTYGLRATSSPQDNLMWIINDLSVCGSRSFSPAEHPCRYGWVFIFFMAMWQITCKFMWKKKEGQTFQDSKCSRYRSGTQRDGKLDPSMSGKVKKLFPMILETQLSADCIKLGAGWSVICFYFQQSSIVEDKEFQTCPGLKSHVCSPY